MLFQSSNNTLIQKKIDNPNIQYTVFIIPALAYIMANNDLGEGIAGQCKRLVFGFCLGCIMQSVGGLDISLFAAKGGDEVDFTGNLHSAALFILGVAVNNANIHRTATDDKFIVDDVFHDVGHFLLTEADAGIPEADIFAVVLVGIVKVVFALYIPALTLAEKECIRKVIHVSPDGIL